MEHQHVSGLYDIFVAMKWLGCTFALYMLLLSGIPCPATSDCCPEETVAMQHTDAHSADANKEAEDCPCPLLFSCNASACLIVHTQTFVPEKNFVAGVQPIPAHLAPPLSDYSAFIWQPPRLDRFA